MVYAARAERLREEDGWEEEEEMMGVPAWSERERVREGWREGRSWRRDIVGVCCGDGEVECKSSMSSKGDEDVPIEVVHGGVPRYHEMGSPALQLQGHQNCSPRLQLVGNGVHTLHKQI